MKIGGSVKRRFFHEIVRKTLSNQNYRKVVPSSENWSEIAPTIQPIRKGMLYFKPRRRSTATFPRFATFAALDNGALLCAFSSCSIWFLHYLTSL